MQTKILHVLQNGESIQWILTKFLRDLTAEKTENCPTTVGEHRKTFTVKATNTVKVEHASAHVTLKHNRFFPSLFIISLLESGA